jgi:hypothetical protein
MPVPVKAAVAVSGSAGSREARDSMGTGSCLAVQQLAVLRLVQPVIAGARLQQ